MPGERSREVGKKDFRDTKDSKDDQDKGYPLVTSSPGTASKVQEETTS